ncbi:SpaA isopeptide-forming pilin-related protein [Clostridium perfringens]
MKKKYFFNFITAFIMFFNILLSSFYPITVYAKNEYEYWGYTTNAPDGGPNSTNNEAYYMTNGSETKRVFCINRNAAAPWGYDFDSSKRFGDIYREVSGTQSELLKGVNGNKYGDKLEENVRKVFYYVSQNNLTTLTSNKLIWEVTGSDMGLTDEEQNLFTSIINGPKAPGNFVLDLYQPKKSDMQVLARGYIDNTLKDIAISKQDLGGKELPGAKIEIKNEDGSKIIEKWISSNQEKHIYLKPGNYIFHEEAAPNGYLKVTDIKFTVDNNGNVKVVSFGKDDKVVAEGNKLTVTDKDDTKEVIFSKQDLDGNELAGATIELKKADGTVIETWKSDGKAHSFQLVAGDYIFHESAAPEGYEVATDINFTVKNDGTVTSNDVKVSGDSKNHIVMVDDYSPREIIISKQDLGGNELPGAEIQIKNEDGSKIIENWTSSDQEKHLSLKPGNYIFHEEAAPNGYLKVTDITFTVDNNGNVKVVSFGKDDKVVAEGNKLTVTDKDDRKEIIISKQDLGGKELPGAKIQIKNEDGSKIIENWTSSDQEKHLSLKPGNYIFHEEAAPNGYLKVTDITFTVNNNGNVKVVSFGKDDKVVAERNKLIVTDKDDTKEVIFSKQDLGGNELAGATIELKKADGTVIETWKSDGKAHSFQLVAGDYIFHESAAPDGYEVATDIAFTVKNDGTVTSNDVKVSGDSKNHIVMVDDYSPREIIISKQDLGGNELPGAEIQIKNEDGSKIIENWTSSDQEKHLSLKPGNYIFHEEAAPNGYLKVTDIKFTVDNDGNVKVVSFGKDDKVVAEGNKLTVTDKDDTKEVIFSKQDLGGNELAGATIELKKADGTLIETWKSDGKAHSFQLVAGDYIFHESAAPEGYEVATDIAFTVKNDGTVTSNDVKVSGDSNNHIVMVDGYSPREIIISKQDLGGNELPGAEIQIKNESGDTVVEKWTSSNQEKHISLKPGNYIFHEEAAPNGYLKVTDITFTVDNNGNVKVVSFGKDDKVVAEGNKLTVTDKDDTKEVIFSKQDLGGNELAGATIELKKADGTVIETWKSDGKAHSFQLIAGDYIFHESAAPDGYEVATDINFTVKNDGTVTSNDVKVSGDSKNHIVMVDGYSSRKIIISKQDLGGKELPGAEIQIKNEDGSKIIENWTSSDQEKYLSLKPGNYIFHEEAAPNGYLKVTDIHFKVTTDGKVQVIKKSAADKVTAVDNKLTVVDKNKIKIPNTGDNFLITTILAGTFLLILSCSWFKKRYA